MFRQQLHSVDVQGCQALDFPSCSNMPLSTYSRVRSSRSLPAHFPPRLSRDLAVFVGLVLRECVLFIGTQFSNLYTAVDTPARGRVSRDCCVLTEFQKRLAKECREKAAITVACSSSPFSVFCSPDPCWLCREAQARSGCDKVTTDVYASSDF